MSQTLDELFTAQNQRLFDMLFRHQVYLEGWKTGLAAGYVAFLRTLYGEFGMLLREYRYDRLDQFTKVQLFDFIRKFTIAQGKFYSQYTDDLIKVLRQFMVVELDIHKDILESVTAKDVTEANTRLNVEITPAAYDALSAGLQTDYVRVGDHYELADHYAPNAQASGIYGLAAVREDDRGNAALWGNITNAPMPANGTLMLKTIADFGTLTNIRLTQLINKGYANSSTATDFQDALFGKGPNYTGSLFGTLLNQNTALIATVLQHISSEVQAAVSSLYFEQYQYVAILDNKTTIICRSRDGNVYIYGEGPLPPAHYNCRSKAVPIASGTHLHAIPETYFDWLKTQPDWFLVDVLGGTRAKQLQAGELPGSTFTSISTIKPLTLEEFQGKVKYMLGEVSDAT